MTPRSFLLLAAMVAVALTVALPPWRIHIRQRGDDLFLPWRHAPLWNEAGFSPAEMADHASSRVGAAISPSDCEAILDTPRTYLQLTGLVILAGLGWLVLGEAQSPPATPAGRRSPRDDA